MQYALEVTESFWTYLMRITDNASGVSISRAAEVDAGNVSRWKTGRSNPSAESVVKIARTWGRSPVEALVASGHLRQDEVDGVVELGLDVSALSDDDLIAEVLRRMKGATDADQPDRADPPASTEGTQDEAREDQKTHRNEVEPHPREIERVLAEAIREARQFADGDKKVDLTKVDMPNSIVAEVTRYADLAQRLDPSSAPREVFEVASSLVYFFRNGEELHTQIKAAEAAVSWDSHGPLAGVPSALAQLYEEAAHTTRAMTLAARRAVYLAAVSQDPRLAEVARQPEGLPAGQDGPDRWPDGEPVYDEDWEQWKAWRAAGEPEDWKTYRDGRQEDVELAGGPGMYRIVPGPTDKERFDKAQDDAAERPNQPGPAGGA